MSMNGFNWHLNRLKVHNVTKYSVFIEFFKLETPNKNFIIENKPIYLNTKFHNNQYLYTHLVKFIFSYLNNFCTFLLLILQI
jgi:hypothetical protein